VQPSAAALPCPVALHVAAKPDRVQLPLQLLLLHEAAHPPVCAHRPATAFPRCFSPFTRWLQSQTEQKCPFCRRQWEFKQAVVGGEDSDT